MDGYPYTPPVVRHGIMAAPDNGLESYDWWDTTLSGQGTSTESIALLASCASRGSPCLPLNRFPTSSTQSVQKITLAPQMISSSGLVPTLWPSQLAYLRDFCHYHLAHASGPSSIASINHVSLYPSTIAGPRPATGRKKYRLLAPKDEEPKCQSKEGRTQQAQKETGTNREVDGR